VVSSVGLLERGWERRVEGADVSVSTEFGAGAEAGSLGLNLFFESTPLNVRISLNLLQFWQKKDYEFSNEN